MVPKARSWHQQTMPDARRHSLVVRCFGGATQHYQSLFFVRRINWAWSVVTLCLDAAGWGGDPWILENQKQKYYGSCQFSSWWGVSRIYNELSLWTLHASPVCCTYWLLGICEILGWARRWPMAIGYLPANCIGLCCLSSTRTSERISEHSKEPNNGMKLVCFNLQM